MYSMVRLKLEININDKSISDIKGGVKIEIKEGTKTIKTINIKLDNKDRQLLDNGKDVTYQLQDELFINLSAKRPYKMPESNIPLLQEDAQSIQDKKKD